MSGDHSPEYYVCAIILDGETTYFIWYSDANDGVVTDGPSVIGWSSEPELRQFAAASRMTLASEKTQVFDLDAIDRYANHSLQVGDPHKLDAWNLLADIAVSVDDGEFIAADRQRDAVYHHLFYLSGLPPVEGTDPEPLGPVEDEAVRTLFSLGLRMVRRALEAGSGRRHERA